MDLVAFDPEHRCPKCLHAPADVQHRSQITEGERNWLTQEPLDPQPEHLHMRCIRCGFLWQSETADTSQLASR